MKLSSIKEILSFGIRLSNYYRVFLAAITVQITVHVIFLFQVSTLLMSIVFYIYKCQTFEIKRHVRKQGYQYIEGSR